MKIDRISTLRYAIGLVICGLTLADENSPEKSDCLGYDYDQSCLEIPCWKTLGSCNSTGNPPVPIPIDASAVSRRLVGHCQSVTHQSSCLRRQVVCADTKYYESNEMEACAILICSTPEMSELNDQCP